MEPAAPNSLLACGTQLPPPAQPLKHISLGSLDQPMLWRTGARLQLLSASALITRTRVTSFWHPNLN